MLAVFEGGNLQITVLEETLITLISILEPPFQQLKIPDSFFSGRRNMIRGRLDIIYEILSICHKSTNETDISYKCSLSPAHLQKYLKYLISIGLLEEKGSYRITAKGKRFLNGYGHIKELSVRRNSQQKEGAASK